VHAAAPFTDRLFLPLLIANGVTGVREMFSRSAWVDSTRAAIARGAFAGPRIVGAGHILDGRPAIWPGSATATTADEGRRAVDSLRAAGADFIKVYSRLPREAYFAIAAEARRRGITFAGHVPTMVGAAEASDSGQRSIEHLTGLLSACSSAEDEIRERLLAAFAAGGWDSVSTATRRLGGRSVAAPDAGRCRAIAERLVRNGTWLTPTITVLRSTATLDDTMLARDPRLRYLPPAFVRSWDPRQDFRFRNLRPGDWANRRRALARQLEIITQLHRAGVPFLAGTDLSNPYVFPGFSLHDELSHMVRLGFSPLEALRTATLNPARYLGATDSLGTVAPGHLADLVLLEGDPLLDIANTRRIAAVVADGRVYDADAIAGLLAAAERAAGGQ
jgi:imidazolonepropionase-like amidohydrolase